MTGCTAAGEHQDTAAATTTRSVHHPPVPTRPSPYLDQLGAQRVRGPLAVAVHVLLQVGAQVLKHQVQAGLVVLLQVLHAQQPAAGRWQMCDTCRQTANKPGNSVAGSATAPGSPIVCRQRSLDDVVALRQHLQQRDLAQRGGRHALLLHLRSTRVGTCAAADQDGGN